jgi:hypothetical protein
LQKQSELIDSAKDLLEGLGEDDISMTGPSPINHHVPKINQQVPQAKIVVP